MIDVESLIGHHDVLFITIDTLRYDVAAKLLAEGRTPTLQSVLGPDGWEERHSPGTFTYAAHQAFFAGFFPTPVAAGNASRPFALRFPGSRTTGERTGRLEGASIVEGLAARGYHTVCIGGTGFFNKANGLGSVMPSLFRESHWRPSFGVTDPHSTENQILLAEQILGRLPCETRIFLFINVSALHHPNRMYRPGAMKDSVESHAAALEYVDSQLPRLFDAHRRRRSTFVIVCSDHGTAYGEDGYNGHRVGHPVVFTVPYAEFILEEAG